MLSYFFFFYFMRFQEKKVTCTTRAIQQSKLVEKRDGSWLKKHRASAEEKVFMFVA